MFKTNIEEHMCIQALPMDENVCSKALHALSDDLSEWKTGTDKLFTSLGYSTLLSRFIPLPYSKRQERRARSWRRNKSCSIPTTVGIPSSRTGEKHRSRRSVTIAKRCGETGIFEGARIKPSLLLSCFHYGGSSAVHGIWSRRSRTWERGLNFRGRHNCLPGRAWSIHRHGGIVSRWRRSRHCRRSTVRKCITTPS